MIPDEQIKQLAMSHGFKLTNETGDDLKPYVYEFTRDIIALAQQIKPLEWVEVSDALKVVKTICGEYAVFNSITVVSAKFADEEYYSRLSVLKPKPSRQPSKTISAGFWAVL